MFKINFPFKKHYFVMIAFILATFSSINAQTRVNSLAEFRSAVRNSNQTIILEAGDYYLEDLSSNSRVIDCAGSNNTIDMTGARIFALVGSIRETYFTVSGDDNVLLNGAIEDYYENGQSDDITDYGAYNRNSDLAYGLRGAAVMTIFGDDNLVDGLELIVRGSEPYGYGSIYGIGRDKTFGLDKRCGLLITGREGGGQRNTLDGVTMYQNAFGHGIFMQDDASETLIKNCYVEGRMRLSADLYNETNSSDLPFRSNYQIAKDGTPFELPFESPIAIPMDVMYPLSEDGIRSYTGSGSVRVENSTVKQMRGGIRLYLATSATVVDSKAIDCGATNFNLPTNGTITGSSGNFTFGPLNDNRLSRSGQDIELTIIPSPNATGPHNLADILGNNQDIVFHRTPGPVDSDEERAIVITGDNSTIVNETEYTIILESSASGNEITSCGPVIDRGSRNDVTSSNNCDFEEVIAENESPEVTIDAPVNGATFDESEEIRFTATATDDRSISNVKFYVNGTLLVTENIVPYSVSRSIAEAGSYVITAVATDNDGATTTSSEVRITVTTEGETPTEPTEPTPPTTTDGNLVHITKRNATGFAIDGGNGGSNGQNVILSAANTADEGQLWVEIDRGNGFYSYEKFGTNYSLDGNRGGVTNQSVYLWQTNATNQNQQWQKQAVGDGGYKLIKRNATGFAINGGSGGVEGRDVNLWSSASTNQNLQWYITPINEAVDVRLEAEDFDNMLGIQTEASSESGDNVGYINNGDWIRFDDVNLSGITNMDARVATRTGGGTIEVRTGSVTGTLIGSIDVSNTGGYQNWTTLNTGISNTSGVQDVYLVFTGGNGFLFNVNWVEFNTNSRSNKDIDEVISATSKVSIYPNPTTDYFQIESEGIQNVEIYNISGELVKSFNETTDKYLVDGLSNGIYMIKILGIDGSLNVDKLVKQ